MGYSRRQFFGEFGRSLVTNLARATSDAVLAVQTSGVGDIVDDRPVWLRPPGARPEDAFRTTCTRCTDCLDACPYDSIRRLGPEFGKDAGTPAIIPSESPCYLCEDMPCIAACEPRALLPVRPEDARMGTALVAVDKCYLSAGQPCDYCVTRCPLTHTAIDWDQNGLPAVNQAGCVGCGICGYLCPADAITVT